MVYSMIAKTGDSELVSGEKLSTCVFVESKNCFEFWWGVSEKLKSIKLLMVSR